MACLQQLRSGSVLELAVCRIVIVVLLIAASAAIAQSTGILWQAPKPDLPNSLPKASISKEMITTLRIGKVPIVLEETPINEVAKTVGGTIGSRGDASEALQWLCFHGSDADGRWALWLESSEMGGGTVDGFALQRIPSNATVDRRCRKEEAQIDLPIRLRIGLTESEVRGILGAPTAKYRNTLVFDHEHEEKVRNEPFTASNTVHIALRGGVVWAIQVWKGTSN
jgi:hypothetical protein